MTDEEKRAYNRSYNKEYRKTHKDEKRAESIRYRKAHDEEIKAKAKAYRLEHKEELIAKRAANKDKRKAYMEENKERYKEYSKKYLEEHKEEIALKKRAVYYKKKFGITLEEFNKLVEEAGGKCSICEKFFDSTKRETSAVVDHCHKTGKIRGVLCNNCNAALGALGDSVERLQIVYDYLKSFEGIQNG